MTQACAQFIRTGLLLFLIVCAHALPAAESGPLCTTPLHLVRHVDDPLLKRTLIVDEYCMGSRIVSVVDRRTTIVDYSRQEVTEIDHGDATYSITRFDDIARARSSRAPQSKSNARRDWQVRPVGTRTSSASRSLESFEITAGERGHSEKIEVGVDRRVLLSRAAAEALMGAAYPNTRTDEHDQLLNVSRSGGGGDRVSATSAAANAEYGLISEQTTTYEQGSVLVVKNSVVTVDAATIPADALLIDPGARRVESRLIRLDKELADIERLSTPTEKP